MHAYDKVGYYCYAFLYILGKNLAKIINYERNLAKLHNKFIYHRYTKITINHLIEIVGEKLKCHHH